MSKYKVVDQDNYVADLGVELEKEDIVDRDGYRDVETMVREMIDAGERLAAHRREEYDYGPNDDSIDLDPTRAVGFDPADASRIMRSEDERLRQVDRERKEEKEKEKKKVEEMKKEEKKE